eukprot:3971322-Alexandrium_andersonii.AAC.1
MALPVGGAATDGRASTREARPAGRGDHGALQAARCAGQGRAASGGPVVLALAGRAADALRAGRHLQVA